MKPKRKRKAKVLPLYILAYFIGVLLGFWYYFTREPNRIIANPKADYPVEFDYPMGTTIAQLADTLYKYHIIANRNYFVQHCKLFAHAERFQAGYYRIEKPLSYKDLWDILEKGKTYTITVTIPEGLWVSEIIPVLAEKLHIQDSLLWDRCNDTAFIHQLGIPEQADNCEGYLYPNTYNFDYHSDAEVVISRLVKQFFKVINDTLQSAIDSSKFSLHEVVTLASIIQGEAQLTSEMPHISAVFYNRMKKNLKLESCPTVIYAMQERVERLLYKDLEIKSRYNTYKNKGLPPGPICNPGYQALKAALYPLADAKDLYFVAQGDGSHKFSRNLSEHNKGLQIYKQKLNFK